MTHKIVYLVEFEGDGIQFVADTIESAKKRLDDIGTVNEWNTNEGCKYGEIWRGEFERGNYRRYIYVRPYPVY